MEVELFDDLTQSLNEALEYAKGDKTKGRSRYVEMSDNEMEKRKLLWYKIYSLSDSNLQRVDRYVDELLQA